MAPKQRRWKPIEHHNPLPEWILPPFVRWPPNPAYFAAVDRALAHYYARYDSGDKSALLDALELLCMFAPAWVREGFAEAWSRYRQYSVATLGQAFGIKRPKGQHFDRARKREALRPKIVFAVYALHAKGAPLDEGTFEAVGRELGISTSEVSKIFGEPESDGLRELVRNLKISD